jgi:hypothetical protein
MSDRNNSLNKLTPEAKRNLLAEMLAKKKQQPKPYPLSFAQERLWFLEQYAPGQSVFNMPLAYEITGRLSVDILRQSVNEIIDRHDTLRTIFKAENGRPVQLVLPTQQIDLPLLDIQNASESEQKKKIEAERERLFQETFNLETGPLVRGLLVNTSPENHLLFLAFHHIIADGWSLGVFFQELVAIYKVISAGQPIPLPPLPVQYKTYIERQQAEVHRETFSEHLSYWLEALANAPLVMSLPTDRPRPAIQSHSGRRISFPLGEELTTAVKHLCQSEQVTPFMLLLAAFNHLLARYTGQSDLLIGTPIAGRNDDDVEPLIGLFLNILVIRTRMDQADTFRELLKQVRQTALSSYEHQDFPFEKLIDELNPARNLSHNPLYQVWFAMQNQPWERFELPGLEIRQLESFTGTSKVDLSIFIMDGRNGFEGICEYNSDLFDETTIKRLVGHYQVLVDVAVSQPDLPLHLLPILTAEERRQQQRWNQTQQPYPNEQGMHQWFESQVARTPDAAAITFQDQSLTYQKLNQKANQLAHYLQELGVGPDVRVGIHLERSLEMLIAVLAVFKSGGAYVPLDPALPNERLAYMVANADVQVLLTTSDVEPQISLNEGIQHIYIDAVEPTISTYPLSQLLFDVGRADDGNCASDILQ